AQNVYLLQVQRREIKVISGRQRNILGQISSEEQRFEIHAQSLRFRALAFTDEEGSRQVRQHQRVLSVHSRDKSLRFGNGFHDRHRAIQRENSFLNDIAQKVIFFAIVPLGHDDGAQWRAIKFEQNRLELCAK